MVIYLCSFIIWWVEVNSWPSYFIILLFIVKPESKLWHTLKENLKGFHLTRFENWAVPGVPDVHGCKDGIPFWIELKVMKGNKINLSPHQIMWNYKYSLHGGRSFIMAQHLGLGLLYIFPGSLVHSIASIGSRTEPKWTFDLSSWPWTQLGTLLLHCPLPLPPSQQ